MLYETLQHAIYHVMPYYTNCNWRAITQIYFVLYASDMQCFLTTISSFVFGLIGFCNTGCRKASNEHDISLKLIIQFVINIICVTNIEALKNNCGEGYPNIN